MQSTPVHAYGSLSTHSLWLVVTWPRSILSACRLIPPPPPSPCSPHQTIPCRHHNGPDTRSRSRSFSSHRSFRRCLYCPYRRSGSLFAHWYCAIVPPLCGLRQAVSSLARRRLCHHSCCEACFLCHNELRLYFQGCLLLPPIVASLAAVFEIWSARSSPSRRGSLNDSSRYSADPPTTVRGRILTSRGANGIYGPLGEENYIGRRV